MGCVLLYSSPNGPKQYGPERTEGCTVTTTCMNSNDLTDIITVKCPGTKKCKDWSEPWIDQYRCEEIDNGGCVVVTYPTKSSTKTGTECGNCSPYAGGDCGCPDGYMKLS